MEMNSEVARRTEARKWLDSLGMQSGKREVHVITPQGGHGALFLSFLTLPLFSLSVCVCDFRQHYSLHEAPGGASQADVPSGQGHREHGAGEQVRSRYDAFPILFHPKSCVSLIVSVLRKNVSSARLSFKNWCRGWTPKPRLVHRPDFRS